MPKNSKSRSQGKKAGKKPAPRVARNAPARGPMPTATGLSKCSDDYAKSLIQPWGPEAPCLPSGFPLPSLKRKFFARGTFGQGTTTGFIIFNPLKGISSDEDSVLYTVGGFTGADMSITPVASQIVAARLNSSYTYAQFGVNEGLRVRIVSAGIRVRYDGTELNRGGRIIPIEHPTHGSLHGFSATDILAMQGVVPVRPSSDGKWVTVVSSGPKQAVELNYSIDPNQITQGAPFLGIMVNGGVAPTAGTANFVLEFECWANYEIVGTNLSGQTISHHDPIGASLAANAVSTAQMQAPHSGSPGFGSTVVSLIGKYGREAVTDSGKFLWNNRSTIMKGIGDAAMLL